MTKEKESEKLSPLAKKAEKALMKALDDIVSDFKISGSKYSLTDLMKVSDRVLKLEAIRNSVKDDGEGSFFTPGSYEESNDRADDDE
jgi:hypothetical protein